MAGFDNKSMYAYRSRKMFKKFLETYSIEYVEKGGQLGFEKGSRYMISFGESDIILCDDHMNIVLKESVFEVMHYLSGAIDIYV